MVGPLEFLDAGRQCGFISFSVVLLMCANGSQAQTSVLGAVTVLALSVCSKLLQLSEILELSFSVRKVAPFVDTI